MRVRGDFLSFDIKNTTLPPLRVNWGAIALFIKVEFFENEILNVSLPERITCIVKETEPTIKGQTAASSYKPAKLDNGINIMVPPFVEEGDKIILDTRSLEYVKKINWWK